jgi:carbohydrate-selective porin OprB
MWWIPLLVALAAAAGSYAVTWRFKRADVDRENALRAIDLVDEAERIAAFEDLSINDGPTEETYRILQEARARAEPLDDKELDKRFQAALIYNSDLQGWRRRRARRAAGYARLSRTYGKGCARI